LSFFDDDYKDYLHDLGWLDHKPGRGYPRSGVVGETVYAEEWADLMQKLDRDGINAPNSQLAGILADLQERITQRHAFVCASVMCWLGSACGQSIILNGKRFREHIRNPYLVAWTMENQRSTGVNNGYRTIEHILAPDDHFGVDVLMPNLGKRLMRLPELSVSDLETVDHLMVWLGRHGEGFILRCERRIEELNRFEWTKRADKHRQDMERCGLAASDSAVHAVNSAERSNDGGTEHG